MVVGTQTDLVIWASSLNRQCDHMNDRGPLESDAGQIGGRLYISISTPSFFLLTPVAP
jgi:hypothetical protein